MTTLFVLDTIRPPSTSSAEYLLYLHKRNTTSQISKHRPHRPRYSQQWLECELNIIVATQTSPVLTFHRFSSGREPPGWLDMPFLSSDPTNMSFSDLANQRGIYSHMTTLKIMKLGGRQYRTLLSKNISIFLRKCRGNINISRSHGARKKYIKALRWKWCSLKSDISYYTIDAVF